MKKLLNHQMIKYIFILSVIVYSSSLSYATDDEDATMIGSGQVTFRDSIHNQNEKIDPFTGSVTLSYDDLFFPGDGGLDLKITRVYKTDTVVSYTPGFKSLMGNGWNITFGSLYQNNNRIHVTLPDGTESVAYKKYKGSNYDYITKDFWKVYFPSSGDKILTLTDGTKITFGKSNGGSWRYATKIEKGCNSINITYLSGSDNKIDKVTYKNSGISKNVTFTYFQNSYRISSISLDNDIKKIIKYTYTTDNKELKSVSFPTGEKWEYEYASSPKYLLSKITTPYGGVYNYTFGWVYKPSDFLSKKGQISILNKNINDKNNNIFTWNYEYKYVSGSYDYTKITDSDNRTEEFRYYGFKSSKSGECYKYGLQQSKITQDNGIEEITEYTWSKLPNKISTYKYIVKATCGDDDIFVPILTNEVITRDGTKYTKNYSNFDEYGNVGTVTESGSHTKTINTTYWKNIDNNIVKGFAKTVNFKGDNLTPGDFSINYTYNDTGSSLGKIKLIDKYGVATSYTYDDNANLSSIKNANNNITYYSWSNGSISKITNDYYSISRVINLDGTVKSETNGRGFTTNYSYDDNMRLTKITPPAGTPTTVTYKLTNGYLTEKIKTRNNFSETSYYDGTGRIFRNTNSLGAEKKNFFRANGVTDHTTSNIGDNIYYDRIGRILSVIHKDDTSINYEYTNDADFSIFDELGNTTVIKYKYFGYPEEKFISTVIDANKKYTYYDYNILGSLTAIRDGHLTRSYQYDGKNFLKSESHPESGTTTYTIRDNIGNLKQKIETGTTINYTYDSLSRLTSMISGNDYQKFIYDNNNNTLTASSPDVDISYSYDSADRILGVTSKINNLTKQITYSYDGSDNITQVTYPSGTIANYTYNTLNQVTNISGFGGQLSNIHYHTAAPKTGLLKDYTRGNGQVVAFDWDKRRKISSSGPSQYLLKFGYDSRGNLTQYTQAGNSHSYNYDALNRISVFNGPWGRGTYTYDSNDNMTKFSIGASTTTYTFDTASNRLIKENNTAIGYDGGNVTNIGNLNLTYDPFNNMLLAQENSTPLGRYDYDAFNKRVRKDADNQITHYYYDNYGNVLSEMSGTGQNIYDYVYLNNILVARVGQTVAPN